MIVTADWNFKAKPRTDGRWTAWAAKVANLGEGPLDMKALPYGTEVHFEVGDTEADALRRLKLSIAN